MELRHLRYFVMVARERHFGRAAERLFMAQPPLSQQIIQLEREIGTPLLLRNSRKVEMTAAGEVFLEDAERILERVEAATRRALRAARGEAGWLGVGFAASATHELLPRVLRAFGEECPDVELALYEMTTVDQSQALQDGRIHVGLARPAAEDKALTVRPLLREGLVAALPRAHPLAAHESLGLTDLKGEPFITYPRRPAPSFAEHVALLCEAAGFAPKVVQETRQMQTALSLVAAGLGVAVLPESVRAVPREGVVYRAIATPGATTLMTLAHRPRDPSPTLARFLAVTEAVATHLTQEKAGRETKETAPAP